MLAEQQFAQVGPRFDSVALAPARIVNKMAARGPA